MARIRRVPLGPLMGSNGTRITDRALQGTYMRGAYNVELRDGEWWTRKGEQTISTRFGSTIWRWVFDVNRDLSIICNEWYALAWDNSNNRVAPLYEGTAMATLSTAFTASSATCTVTGGPPVVNQLLLRSGSGFTQHVYRVTAVSGAGPYTVTLDRPYENGTETLNCRFIDSLARNTAGTWTTHSNGSQVGGSAVLFEQLVTNPAGPAAGSAHGASPATTGGNLYLIIVGNRGVPVAINITAYLGAAAVAPLRLFFYNTALGTPTQIGSNTSTDGLTPRGVWAEVYKNRLFIAAAPDPNGNYGSRTIWWSQIGDFTRWHTGISGQTAAPNFKTFDGEANGIAEMKTLQDALIIHRDYTQVICNATGSSAQPFSFRENNQGIGIRHYIRRNRVVVAAGVHFLWTEQGLAVFDGNAVTPVAREALSDWYAMQMIGARSTITLMLHDPLTRRIYCYGGGRRHTNAKPDLATITYTSGDQVSNYISCFVYDYATNAFWWEDRPYAAGGGTATVSNANPPQLIASRVDGTLVAITNRTRGSDPDHLAPETSGSDVLVYAQVETPWIDFGTNEVKVLKLVETSERSHLGGGLFDPITSVTDGNWWLRLRVYADHDPSTALADVGAVVDSTDAQLSTTEGQYAPSRFVRVFTPRVHGRQFKLRFSNDLTSAASAVSYKQAPFRLSDITCDISDRQGTQPLTDMTGASISE